MDAIFGHFFEPDGSSGATWIPACEVYARDGKVVVRCDVPGVDPGDIHVAVRGRPPHDELAVALRDPGSGTWKRKGRKRLWQP